MIETEQMLSMYRITLSVSSMKRENEFGFFSPLYLQCVSTVPGTEYLVNIYRMNQ